MEQKPPVSKAVLSLDDDVEVCALLEHLLWPHRVIGVAHAYVALELLAREAFDLFILDVWMPDMDGLELCRRIRDEDPNAPIVICSGAATPTSERDAMSIGASAYHAKPLEPGTFKAGIERLLAIAEARNRHAEAVVRQWVAADVQSAAAPVRAELYRRFVAAGGTRAHFQRVWPGTPEKAIAGTAVAPIVVRATDGTAGDGVYRGNL